MAGLALAVLIGAIAFSKRKAAPMDENPDGAESTFILPDSGASVSS